MNILRMNSLVALETKIVESKILVWWEMICFQIHLHNELKTPVNQHFNLICLKFNVYQTFEIELGQQRSNMWTINPI